MLLVREQRRRILLGTMSVSLGDMGGIVITLEGGLMVSFSSYFMDFLSVQR